MNNIAKSTLTDKPIIIIAKAILALILLSGFLVTILFSMANPKPFTALLAIDSMIFFIGSTLLIFFLTLIKFAVDTINQKQIVKEVQRLLEKQHTNNGPYPPAEK